MDDTTRGGKRRNAGRKTEPEIHGETVSKHTVTLDSMTLRKLRVLGDGNVSRGIRRSARESFDRYQQS